MVIPNYNREPHYGVKLAPHTTWKIGGPAKIFVTPRTKEELTSVASFARINSIPLFVIGNGSNILIDDQGYEGIVVSLQGSFSEISVINREYIKAGAACLLPNLAISARKNHLSKFEFMIGIPGTVGGGIACNAGIGGVNGPSVSDILEAITAFDLRSSSIYTVSANEMHFSYRYSEVNKNNIIVIDAVFKGSTASYESIKKREREILKNRQIKFPLYQATAGSVFKQPEGGKPAGWYIDNAGLKGYKIGGAEISKKHANWIINDGTATSRDVMELIKLAQETVFSKYGVHLEREVIFLPQDRDYSSEI